MLTDPQIATLRTALLAETDAGFVALRSAGATGAMAEFYNVAATPDYWVWRTSVTKDEYVGDAGPEGTTFIWAGNGFITRSVGEQAAWRELTEDDAVNPSLANVRQAFLDIFSGTGNAASNRTHLTAVSRRKATRGEKLFATGTGSTAAPGLLTFEGAIGDFDIVRAIA